MKQPTRLEYYTGLPLWGWLIALPLCPIAAWILAELMLVGGPF